MVYFDIKVFNFLLLLMFLSHWFGAIIRLDLLTKVSMINKFEEWKRKLSVLWYFHLLVEWVPWLLLFISMLLWLFLRKRAIIPSDIALDWMPAVFFTISLSSDVFTSIISST